MTTALVAGASALLAQKGAAQPARASASPPLIALEDYERAARGRVDPAAWAYIEGGAADELTLRWNLEAYRSLQVLPRQLRDVARIDTSTSLLGHTLAHPVLLAPAACHKLVHPEGEVATARGARAAAAGMVLSSYSTVPIELVAREKPPLFWFQLYVQDRAYTLELIRRACAAGASAIAVTVDTPVGGARNRQERAGFQFPKDLPHISGAHAEHPLKWSDLEWIRAASTVPILLKGILHPEDAELGIAAGAAGIMVSNHGARNLDTTPASIDALPAVADRVAGRVPVILDGGIRRGTDVMKALAHGADAVMVGRPLFHGLAVDGAAGVESVISILRHELAMAMALAGRPTIASLDRSLFFGKWTPPAG